MPVDKQQLIEIGLSKKQAEIYLYILKSNSSTVLEISRGTGIARSTLYGQLLVLVSNGLVEESYIKRKRFYSITKPRAIVDLVNNNLEKTKQLIGVLNDEFENEELPPYFYYFRKFSVEVHNKMWNSIIHQKVAYKYEFGTYELWKEYVANKNSRFFKSLYRYRRNKNTVSVFINSKKDSKKFIEDASYPGPVNLDRSNIRRTRVLKEDIHFEMNISIYADWVCLMAPLSEKYILIFKSVAFSKTFECFFSIFKDDSVDVDYLENKS